MDKLKTDPGIRFLDPRHKLFFEKRNKLVYEHKDMLHNIAKQIGYQYFFTNSEQRDAIRTALVAIIILLALMLASGSIFFITSPKGELLKKILSVDYLCFTTIILLSLALILYMIRLWYLIIKCDYNRIIGIYDTLVADGEVDLAEISAVTYPTVHTMEITFKFKKPGDTEISYGTQFFGKHHKLHRSDTICILHKDNIMIVL